MSNFLHSDEENYYNIKQKILLLKYRNNMAQVTPVADGSQYF